MLSEQEQRPAKFREQKLESFDVYFDLFHENFLPKLINTALNQPCLAKSAVDFLFRSRSLTKSTSREETRYRILLR